MSAYREPCCRKCGESGEFEDLWRTGEGLLCFACFLTEFGHEPQREPVDIDALNVSGKRGGQ